MEIKEIVTLLLAIYGAILSTILLVNEIKKERRKISVFLEFVAFLERAQLTIVNVGHRPITIVDISGTWVIDGKKDTLDPIPRGELFGDEINEGLLPFRECLKTVCRQATRQQVNRSYIEKCFGNG